MSELSARGRRRVLRRELWRHGGFGLSLAALITGVGAALYGMGIPLAFFTFEVYGHWPMDESLRNWLLIVAMAMILVLGWTGTSWRPLLRRLPIEPADELRSRLEIGLACGACVFMVFLVAEFLGRPVMMNPSFGSRLNPAEVATLERLGGVPLLRFTVDGEVRRTLATDLSLARLRKKGLEGYGRRQPLEGDASDLEEGLPPRGKVLDRITVSFRQACMTSAEPGRYRQCPMERPRRTADEAGIPKRPSE